MPKDLVIVACDVLDLSFERLKLLELLKENGYTLDDISGDLVSIIKDRNDSLLRIRSLEVELSDMALGSEIEYSSSEFYLDIDNILRNIFYRLNQINIRGKELISIHFKDYGSLFFTFK